jgi:hypothetical protein
MTLHQLGNVFEAIMEKGQDQIPDDGFLMTNMLMYFIVTVDKILLKPLGQMNRNLVGSIYGMSSLKIAHFVPIV